MKHDFYIGINVSFVEILILVGFYLVQDLL